MFNDNQHTMQRQKKAARRITKNTSKTRNATVATPDTTTSAVVSPTTDKRRIPLVILLTVVVVVAIACLLNPDWFSKTRAPVDGGGGAKETQQDPALTPDPPDPVFIVVAIVMPVTVIMSIIGYQAFVSGTLKEHIKRVSSYLGIVGLCVAAGGIVRLYPSSWNKLVSNVLICVGYLLGLYLVVKEFDLLPWDRKKKDDEERKKKERKKIIRASLLEWAKGKKTEVDLEKDLARKQALVEKLAADLDLRILLNEKNEKEEQEVALLRRLRGAVMAWNNNDPAAGDKMWRDVDKSLDEKK